MKLNCILKSATRPKPSLQSPAIPPNPSFPPSSPAPILAPEMPETIEEDEKKDLGHGSSAEEVQKEEISPVKSPAQRGRKPKTETSETKPKEADEESAEKKQRRSVGTLSAERPARERKAVERYAALSPRRVTPSKIPPIEQVNGTSFWVY